MAHLNTRQIKQLIEIDNAGSGIRAEVQVLISRLTSGGVGVKTDDPREAQAKRLYDQGLFSKVESFANFLATIPEIPEAFKAASDRFPELVLVDTRLPVTKICKLLGIEFPGNDESYVDFDPKTVKTDKVYWIRAQDGRKNNGRSVRACRESFTEDEVGLSVYEGLALFLQDQKELKRRGMNLPGSVHCEGRGSAAFLGRIGKQSWWLHWSSGSENPHYGTASRAK